MKTLFLPLFLLAIVCSPAFAQNQTGNRRVDARDSVLRNDSASSPSVTRAKESNHFAKKDGTDKESRDSGGTGSTSGGTSVLANRAAITPAEEYRVGVGDVLDIRVAEVPTRESTLFTILADGAIEYPLLSQPITVAGLTLDEISARLAGEIKVIKGPRILVNIRDYSSHGVIVTGLVDSPGRKALRREAVPLYTVLAEALPRAEASNATIVRRGQSGQLLKLSVQKDMATLVLPGDTIRITGNSEPASQFFYVGGRVISPGEKEFHAGMTLTQALLACGGTTREAGNAAKIFRRNSTGFLTSSDYDLRAIQEGRTPDPLLQPGDRIEVGQTTW